MLSYTKLIHTVYTGGIGSEKKGYVMVGRLVIVMGVLLLLVVPSLAHDPYIEAGDWGGFDTPQVVMDNAISYAFYGYLDEADIDVFTVRFAAADEILRIELLVPQCGEHYSAFYPDYVVLAPDMDGEAATDLPFEIPEGYGVLFHETYEVAGETRGTFTEPFGGTVFYEAERHDITVPQAGDYYIVVFDPDGATGDYTLATGYQERFESDLGQMMANVATIRSDRWLHRDCALSPDDPAAIINLEAAHGHDDHAHEDDHHHAGD